MQKRFVIFVVLSILIWIGNLWFINTFYPPAPKPKPDAAAKDDKPKADGEKPADAAQPDGGAKPADAPPKADAPPDKPAVAGEQKPADQQPAEPQQWFTLGSGDPTSGYRMLVTLTNRGAAVVQAELNEPRYRELEDWEHRGGHLGFFVNAPLPHKGCLVPSVGAGTPADAAGLKAGDIITEAGGSPVENVVMLRRVLQDTAAGAALKLAVERDGKPVTLEARLGHRPQRVVQTESGDPSSFLLTFDSLDGAKIEDDSQEIAGLKLRTETWRTLPNQPDGSVAFAWTLADKNLEIVKRYQLAKGTVGEGADLDEAAYHVELTLEIRHTGTEGDRTLAYRLDGPTGLPTEGFWYAYKVSRDWGQAGMRDYVSQAYGGNINMVTCVTVSEQPWGQEPENKNHVGQDAPLEFVGVDALYFASALLPVQEKPDDQRFAKWMPIRVSDDVVDKADRRLTNVTCRVISKSAVLKPGESLKQSFKAFIGPKRPAVLAKYGLDELVYFGWFGWVARPMLHVLHFFYAIIPNYGLAIILLTVLVRSAMFPVSRKQVLSAQKMQEIQPELKKLAEKHKGNMEARSKAQQELFRKHNYNPLSGCLPMFLQLPIFVGLYRSLAVDIELRNAPLLSEAIRWCSNLAAPDMFFFWMPYLPGFFAAPNGWLGPYLNLLPLATVALFIVQQKMFMPPPTDEQAAMQQKMMKYMMLVIGFMFFKVPSGLCIYFIASSLWGIAERKLLPKPKLATESGRLSASPSGNGADNMSSARRKQRDRK